jgi:spore germination protein YaaH
MELFEKYKIEANVHGNTLILYINPEQTEFGSEFFHSSKERIITLQKRVNKIVNEKFPNAKVSTVKVMIGTTLAFSFPMNDAEAHNAEYNMSYLYFGTTSSYIKSVDQTQGSLSTVSPSFFDINTDGSLLLTSQLDPQLVSEMHHRGIRVVPFLSNHWSRSIGNAALENRVKLAEEIAAAIEKYNLDGVNVDIENVNETQRSNYTEFVRLLREKIPAHKEVSVAVAANPHDWKTGWHGSYDYTELAKYADHLLIMAYDEHYQNGPEGPVASIGWVEESILYALNQGVPNDKIVLGIPFFGRYWVEGQSGGGIGISNSRVEKLVSLYGGSIEFDQTSMSPRATFTVTSENSNLSNLSPGTYHMWYENEQSTHAKMALVHKYNLKGTGSWSLRQENPSIWNYYKGWTTNHEQFENLAPIADLDIKYYIEHSVKQGETLWDFSNLYGTDVSTIKKANYLVSDYIYVGQTLQIPILKSSGLSQVSIPNVELPTNHKEPIARLHIRQDVPLLKKDSNGNFKIYKMLKRGEFYRTYGTSDHFYDVGGGYYVFAEDSKMSLYIARILIEENTPLYTPDGSYYRTVRKGEAIRVYSYDKENFNVGGGYYIKNDSKVKYYVGHAYTRSKVPLYNANGQVYQTLPQGRMYRVYGIDGNKINVGGGYYIINNDSVRYSKN